MERVLVERVSATKRKDFIRVYIASERLIEKETIFAIEQEIKNQLFPKVPITIKIYEKYQLSEQYNLEKLMHIYRDSILLELREYSPVEYNLFKKADISYGQKETDGSASTMLLTIEDSVFAQGKSEELVRILEKIFNERFGFSIQIQTAFKEKTSSADRKSVV